MERGGKCKDGKGQGKAARGGISDGSHLNPHTPAGGEGLDEVETRARLGGPAGELGTLEVGAWG